MLLFIVAAASAVTCLFVCLSVCLFACLFLCCLLVAAMAVTAPNYYQWLADV